MVSINGVSNRSNIYKKNNVGAKIGAGMGFVIGLARTFAIRKDIKYLGDSIISSGKSKLVARSSQALAMAMGIGAITMIGVLIGAGIDKTVNYFRKVH